ncbi:hypothetical protein PX699_28310 [Sphingobium sp. H39-3-25]|uniref:hypothetical protein n=1 Tax=Sphingobium arseniciresistens TaxID=3030834 RepID=UPI0023B90094|nr:hypothetical protein [Sphingobium arseniciresistens]
MTRIGPLRAQMLPCALEAAEQTYLSGRIGRRAFIRMAAAAGLAGIAIPALADELEAIRANQDARGRQIAAAGAIPLDGPESQPFGDN